MRTLLFASLVALAAAASVHCAADGAAAEDVDAGSSVTLPPTSQDAEAPTGDAGPEVSVPDAGRCSADRWCRTPLPSADYQLNAVWSFAANDAVAATATSLLRWDGTTWSPIDAPEADGLTSLWATSENDLWGVAKFNYRLVHGTRAAAGQALQWSRIEYDSSSSPSFELVRGVGESELWVYGRMPNGTMAVQRGAITTASDPDGGSVATVAWTTLPIDTPTLIDVTALWVTPNHEVWLAGVVIVETSGAGGVVRGVPSADDSGGYTWTQVLADATGDFVGHTGIWADEANEVWSVGSMGQNFRSAIAQDGGVSWTGVPSNANTPMSGIWGATKNDVWIVGKSGAIRHWDGTKWNVSRLAVGGIPMWQDLNGVHAGPSGDVWAVGSGVALHRTAGGSQ